MNNLQVDLTKLTSEQINLEIGLDSCYSINQ